MKAWVVLFPSVPKKNLCVIASSKLLIYSIITHNWVECTSLKMQKKLFCNLDCSVLLSLTNNAIIYGKIIPRVIALLAEDSKKCYPYYIKVSLLKMTGASI